MAGYSLAPNHKRCVQAVALKEVQSGEVSLESFEFLSVRASVSDVTTAIFVARLGDLPVRFEMDEAGAPLLTVGDHVISGVPGSGARSVGASLVGNLLTVDTSFEVVAIPFSDTIASSSLAGKALSDVQVAEGVTVQFFGVSL
jgi:hypothetical protein